MRRRKKLHCLCLSVAIVSAATAACAEPDTWPHIRGPNYDAHTVWTNVHLPWSKDGPPVLWQQTIGQGYSGFSVANGKIFTQAQTHAGQFVICLDLKTGRTLWQTRYSWPWRPDEDWPGPYASPTYCDGKVFFAGCYGLVGCVDAANGRILWKTHLVNDLKGAVPEFGYACTPLVEEGLVYIQTADGDVDELARPPPQCVILAAGLG